MLAFYVAKRGFEVYAYEPGPRAFSQLKDIAGKFPNFHPYPYALGDEDRTGRLGFAAFEKGGTVDEEINPPGGGQSTWQYANWIVCVYPKLE